MEENFNYNEAIAEVQAIVKELESGATNIDTLTSKIERAATLLKQCKECLTKTDNKIKELLDGLD